MLDQNFDWRKEGRRSVTRDTTCKRWVWSSEKCDVVILLEKLRMRGSGLTFLLVVSVHLLKAKRRRNENHDKSCLVGLVQSCTSFLKYSHSLEIPLYECCFCVLQRPTYCSSLVFWAPNWSSMFLEVLSAPLLSQLPIYVALFAKWVMNNNIVETACTIDCHGWGGDEAYGVVMLFHKLLRRLLTLLTFKSHFIFSASLIIDRSQQSFDASVTPHAAVHKTARGILRRARAVLHNSVTLMIPWCIAVVVVE